MNIDTTEIPWEYLKPGETKPLLGLLFELPDESQLLVEGTLREIHEMASYRGMEAFQKAAKERGISDWSVHFTKRVPLINKAIWVWIHHRELFDYAKSMHQVENAAWWGKRIGLPKEEPKWSLIVKETLENELQGFFLATQGRGHRCTVEMRHYGDCMYYFHVYVDDYVQNALIHDTAGELVSQKTRPTFEIVYAYDMNEGSLEIHVQGTFQTRYELEDIFIATVFDEQIELPRQYPYDLSMFKNPRFSLSVDPLDNIEVLVKELQFRWDCGNGIKYSSSKEPNFIAWIRKTLNENILSLETAEVVFVKLQFLFRVLEGRRRGSLTFEIAVPNRNTLQGKNPKYVRIINKYLNEWRMTHETEPHQLTSLHGTRQ